MSKSFIDLMKKPRMSPLARQGHIISLMIRSRRLNNIQRIDYDMQTACTIDLDDDLMLVGLSNGSVDVLSITDPTSGKLNSEFTIPVAESTINRVQWCPCSEGDEALFTVIDNHNLYLVDVLKMKCEEKHQFSIKTSWSEFNVRTRLIAVCGSESQIRFVDGRVGTSIEQITVPSMSNLPSHRVTRCTWSKIDSHCLIAGDNEGFLHVYDTRKSKRPLRTSGNFTGQISGLSFTTDQCNLVTTHGIHNNLRLWCFKSGDLVESNIKFTNPSSIQAKSRQKKVTPMGDVRLRCQFYVTDTHIFCPTSIYQRCGEVWIYEISSGTLVKTLKADEILASGIYAISGLMNDSMTLFVCGRGRLRVWGIDESKENSRERMTKFYEDKWD